VIDELAKGAGARCYGANATRNAEVQRLVETRHG
jgi:hypothetical protein